MTTIPAAAVPQIKPPVSKILVEAFELSADTFASASRIMTSTVREVETSSPDPSLVGYIGVGIVPQLTQAHSNIYFTMGALGAQAAKSFLTSAAHDALFAASESVADVQHMSTTAMSHVAGGNTADASFAIRQAQTRFELATSQVREAAAHLGIPFNS
jgi:hypothetical protein